MRPSGQLYGKGYHTPSYKASTKCAFFDFTQPSWFEINDLWTWKLALGSSFPLVTFPRFRCMLR